MVEKTADCPLPPLTPTDERHVSQCIRILDANLPRQKTDEDSGTLRMNTYHRKLGHLPRDAVNFIADQALERFDWFPTIKQMLDLAAEWTRSDEPVQARAIASRKARDERQARFEDLVRKLKAGDVDQFAVDALPERTQHMLYERFALGRCPECGSYSPRPEQPAETDEDRAAILARVEAAFPSKRG